MKNSCAIFLIVIAICLAYSSCYYRRNCSASNNIKLGEIDYSDKLKQCNIERYEDTLIFKNFSEVLTLIRWDDSIRYPYWAVHEYNVCTGININAYTASAYYEYENLDSQFRSDSLLLDIHPYMTNSHGVRGESLLLKLSTANYANIKGSVPINNIDAAKMSYASYGEFFKYHESIDLNGKIFTHIWVCKRRGTGVYYSKTLGIVALEAKNKIYVRA